MITLIFLLHQRSFNAFRMTTVVFSAGADVCISPLKNCKKNSTSRLTICYINGVTALQCIAGLPYEASVMLNMRKCPSRRKRTRQRADGFACFAKQNIPVCRGSECNERPCANASRGGSERGYGRVLKTVHRTVFLTLPCPRSTVAGICTKSATQLPPRADRQGCPVDNTFRIQNLAVQAFALTHKSD